MLGHETGEALGEGEARLEGTVTPCAVVVATPDGAE